MNLIRVHRRGLKLDSIDCKDGQVQECIKCMQFEKFSWLIIFEKNYIYRLRVFSSNKIVLYGVSIHHFETFKYLSFSYCIATFYCLLLIT